MRNIYISACIHDSNKIPTSRLMLSRSGIMTELVRILSNVRVSGMSKMAAYIRKCIEITFISACMQVQSWYTTSENRYNRWNFIFIMYTSWDIRYFISTFGSRPPSLIFHLSWCRPVLKFVQLCCSMQKICGFRWNFTYFPSPMSGFSISGFTSTILISGWTRVSEYCLNYMCSLE